MAEALGGSAFTGLAQRPHRWTVFLGRLRLRTRNAMPQRKQTGLRLRDTIHRHSLRHSLIIGITLSYFLR
jgi:hypothetical protein